MFLVNHLWLGCHRDTIYLKANIKGQEKIDTIFVRLLLRVIIAYKMPPAWPGYQKVTTFLTA
jgi:hypothetical protein